MNCPIEIYVDGDHKLEAIATDGVDIEIEETADALVIAGGERSDHIPDANILYIIYIISEC